MSEIARKAHEPGMEFLGRPLDRERGCRDGRGRYRHYQGGSIFWHPETGAHEVHGDILGKWKGLRCERGLLGYPLTDETATPDRIGRYNHFQKGSIYWFPTTGAHEVHGAIRSDWAGKGWERSFLRYPTTDELVTRDGLRYSRFQGGDLMWTPESGVRTFAEGSNRHLTDARLRFELPRTTPHGDLHEFLDLMDQWYGIDLREGLIGKGTPREKCIFGWPYADFTKSDELNGHRLSGGERLILTAAVILIVQWWLRDLVHNDRARHAQIDKYCRGCFKRNHAGGWRYNRWCSEFVSYLYWRSGNALKIPAIQSWMCRNRWRLKKNDWCAREVRYLKGYFEKIRRYSRMADFRRGRVPPAAGDYLRTLKHSMMVLGYDRQRRRIYIIEGNAGWGSTQGRGKRVRVGWIPLDHQSLVGIGRHPLVVRLT